MSTPSTAPAVRPAKETSDGHFVQVAEGVATPEGRPILVALDQALHEVLAKVIEIGKPGTVELVLSINPWGTGQGDVPMYIVKGEVKAKKPQRKPKGQTFFLGDDNKLTRQGPGQTPLPLQSAS